MDDPIAPTTLVGGTAGITTLDAPLTLPDDQTLASVDAPSIWIIANLNILSTTTINYPKMKMIKINPTYPLITTRTRSTNNKKQPKKRRINPNWICIIL